MTTRHDQARHTLRRCLQQINRATDTLAEIVGSLMRDSTLADRTICERIDAASRSLEFADRWAGTVEDEALTVREAIHAALVKVRYALHWSLQANEPRMTPAILDAALACARCAGGLQVRLVALDAERRDQVMRNATDAQRPTGGVER